MRNPFKRSLEKEIENELDSLERRIVSSELDLITRERHVEELYEKREYLRWRVSQNREITHENLPVEE